MTSSQETDWVYCIMLCKYASCRLHVTDSKLRFAVWSMRIKPLIRPCRIDAGITKWHWTVSLISEARRLIVKRVVVIIIVGCAHRAVWRRLCKWVSGRAPLQWQTTGGVGDWVGGGGSKPRRLIAFMPHSWDLCNAEKKNLINFTGRYNHPHWRTLHFHVRHASSDHRFVLFFYLNFVTRIRIVFYHLAADEITSPNGGKFRWTALMYYCIGVWTWVYFENNSYRRKKINSDWGTFNMFNIIETLRNYFEREVLPDSLSNELGTSLQR